MPILENGKNIELPKFKFDVLTRVSYYDNWKKNTR